MKRSMVKTLGVAAALSLALAACGDNPFGPDPREIEFAASLGIDLDQMTETASGLFIREDSIGVGVAAITGDRVTVFFTGWLVDGTEFDSGELLIPSLGIGTISGFTEGVTGMQTDGIRTIVVPADLGFSSPGPEGIPEDAVLIFEITVLEIVRPPGG